MVNLVGQARGQIADGRYQLVPSWLVGSRDGDAAKRLLPGLQVGLMAVEALSGRTYKAGSLG
jgi:hypothetical protein